MKLNSSQISALLLFITSYYETITLSFAFSPQSQLTPSRVTTTTPPTTMTTTTTTTTSLNVQSQTDGSLHGQNACFLPLKQLDQDYYAPRIIQIAGAYPGITKEEYDAVTSEPPAEMGQWTYDFSDPDGPQMGTVAVDGSNIVSSCEDPVVIICDHTALGVPLPDEIKDAVDLVVVCDRAYKTFAERKFLVLDMGHELKIAAYEKKVDLPEGSIIVGHVQLCQIPWLPAMKPSKSGFMEEDEYF